jgi:glycerate kinase
MTQELDAALRHYGEIIERDLHVFIIDVSGAGAASALAPASSRSGAHVRPGSTSSPRSWACASVCVAPTCC